MSSNQFLRDASGRLTFEMDDVPADRYRAMTRKIVKAFRLLPSSILTTNHVDIAFQDFERNDGEQIVGLEWDNWSGYIVVAKNPASESLVREIAIWLEKHKSGGP